MPTIISQLVRDVLGTAGRSPVSSTLAFRGTEFAPETWDVVGAGLFLAHSTNRQRLQLLAASDTAGCHCGTGRDARDRLA